MLNFSRNDRPVEPPKDPKLAQRPTAPAVPPGPPPAAPRAPSPSEVAPPPATSAAPMPAPQPSTLSDNAGSRLSIGPNINLKGVEISNCDVLVIAGNVEATIISKVMEIAQPGRLDGTATIDVAEVHGEFSGELTAREKLVVHATGRVTGTVRYGKLVVTEGGMINGELTQLDASGAKASANAAAISPGAVQPPRAPLAPQPH
jgi:cytoskeletal protein CcmA (bactofilin family)